MRRVSATSGCISKVYTPALDETHVHEESISDVHDALVESSILSHDVSCSLSTSMIKEEIEHEIIAISESLGVFLLFVSLLLVFLLLVIIWSSFLSFFRLMSVLVMLYH